MVPGIAGKIDQLNVMLASQARATQESVDAKVAGLEAKLAASSQIIDTLAAQIAAQSAVQVKASQDLASQVSSISMRLGVNVAADPQSSSAGRPPIQVEPETTPCVEQDATGEPESTSPSHVRLPEPSEPESEQSVEPSRAARVEVKAEVSPAQQAPTEPVEEQNDSVNHISPAEQAYGQSGPTSLTRPTHQASTGVERQDSLMHLDADEAFDRLLAERQEESAASTSESTFPSNKETATGSGSGHGEGEWRPFG